MMITRGVTTITKSNFSQACNAYNKLTMKETPTLFLEFNGTESSLEEQASTVAEISEANGGSGLEWSVRPEERSRLWKARHSLHYACLALKPGSRLVPTDIAVPMSELPGMLSEARLEIEAAGLTGKSILVHQVARNYFSDIAPPVFQERHIRKARSCILL